MTQNRVKSDIDKSFSVVTTVLKLIVVLIAGIIGLFFAGGFILTCIAYVGVAMENYGLLGLLICILIPTVPIASWLYLRKRFKKSKNREPRQIDFNNIKFKKQSDGAYVPEDWQ